MIVLEALVGGVTVRLKHLEFRIQGVFILERHLVDGVPWVESDVTLDYFLYVVDRMTEEELAVVVGDMTVKRVCEAEYEAGLRKELGPGVHSEDFEPS